MKLNIIRRKYHEVDHYKDFFAKKIIEWYCQNKRKLPWRTKPGQKNFEYRVLVSEFMLQQTTVKTVIPYFKRFIKKWPSINALSKANDVEILLQWQGLGYYSRGRNLLRTAKIISLDFAGKIPQTEKELISLPGVGEYTAAAIRSIAFNKKAVAVDGNIKRVIARFFALKGTLENNLNKIHEFCNLLCPELNNRDYTEGVMEIGATVCKPKSPNCKECVLSSNCKSFINNQVNCIPAPKIRLSKRKLSCITYLAVKNNKSILLVNRENKKILKDQWELPSSDWMKSKPKNIKAHSPIKNIKWEKSKINFNHSFSHIDLMNSLYVTKLKELSPLDKPLKSRWVSLLDLNKYPLTTMSKKTLRKCELI